MGPKSSDFYSPEGKKKIPIGIWELVEDYQENTNYIFCGIRFSGSGSKPHLIKLLCL